MPETIAMTQSARSDIDDRAYSSSESEEYAWGQPPASHYLFMIDTPLRRVISNVYVFLYASLFQNEFDSELKKEISTWETSSIKDFLSFEDGIQ